MADLVVALDFETVDQALALAENLAGEAGGRNLWMKVGLELFSLGGPGVVSSLKDMGFKVFLDLKYFDIPNTVRGAVRSGVRAGADMMTLHLLGGEDMARAALAGAGDAGGGDTVLLGVTLLTSMDVADLPLEASVDTSTLVEGLARGARDWGLSGVVCSGLEAGAVKRACGSGFKCLTPGIRLAGADDDQKRVVTPFDAVRAGADYLVVGRPITRAADPVREVLRFWESMDRA